MRIWILAAALLLAFARPAHAQETGGSIGGGDWGDEPAPSHDTPPSYTPPSYTPPSYTPPSYTPPSYTPPSYPTPSYPTPSYPPTGAEPSDEGTNTVPAPYPTYDSDDGGSGTVLTDGLILFVAATGFGGVVFWLMHRPGDADRAYSDPLGGGGSAGGVNSGTVDVTTLRFGLDARVRPYVQRELERIAKTCDTKTQEGLTRTLNEIALMLRRIRDAWVYGGVHNEAMTDKGEAQGLFQARVSAARATFAHETIRAADGKVSTADAPHHTRLTEEGPGLVLVTLVVAAKQELFTVTRIGDGDELRRALEVLSALTVRTLVAVEIVWTPSDPDDRMSSVELEARLAGEIFPIRGAMVGKVVCSYCGGPFPKELMSCPHCGAPARAAS